MQTSPDSIQPHEPTMKQLWLACFTNLLVRLSPEEAVKEADRSLELCNQHWSSPEWVHTWRYKHSYPVGTKFKDETADEGPLIQSPIR